MIARGDENPYLRGKPAKEYFDEGQWMSGGPFDGMDEAEKAAAVAVLVEKHAGRFATGMARLKEICRTYNAFQLLGHFSYYDLILLDSGKRDPKYTPVEQPAVELLQALILHVAADELRSKIKAHPPLRVFTELNNILNGIVTSFALRRYGNLGDEANRAGTIQEAMRSHTAGVRNEGFPSQVRRTMTELVAPLDLEFEARCGLKLTHLAAMLWNISALIEKRINVDFSQRHAALSSKSTEEIITNFLRQHNFAESEKKSFRAHLARESYSLRDLRGYLTTIWDRNNFLLFALTLEDCISAYPETVQPSRIAWVLSTWSLAHGALAHGDVEHFFLDNPVWSKPFVRFGPEDYLLPIPTAIQSFGRRLLENLIQLESDLWKKYQDHTKGKFLEGFASRLFANAIPSAGVFAGVKWKESSSEKQFETDVLVVVDTQALIIECKSGSISVAARRGAPKSLAGEIAELIQDPTLQSQRFAEYLSSTNQPLELEDTNGQKHQIDPSRLTRVARLNVTLDYFGPLGIQARKLREAGLVAKDLKPAATIPAHELENIAELLDKPPLLFHYLQRRAELESTTDLLTNEGSLLALYLMTGFDLGDFEGPESRALAVSLEDHLEPYFMGKELNRPIPKPKRRFTTWWTDMLAYINLRQKHGWMESSYGLLSCGYEQQKEFERGVKVMLRELKANRKDATFSNACSLVVGHPKNAITLICVGITKATTPNAARNAVQMAYDGAQQEQPTPTTLVIVRSPSKEEYPYTASYFLKEYDEIK